MMSVEESGRTIHLLWLAIFLVIVFAAAGLGSVLGGAMPSEWYQSLRKPAFTPPGWLFGPVWTVLYASMAVAAWLVWARRGSHSVALPLALFAIQLGFNVIWTGLFFRLESPGIAFADLLIVWAVTAATIVAFARVWRLAGLILLPYLAWLSFAAALNWSIWRLN